MMSQAIDITIKDRYVMLHGDLNYLNIMPLLEKSYQLFSSLSDLIIDLTELKSTNSISVALLVEWIRYAKQRRIPIRFINISKQLSSVINAADLEELFGLLAGKH